MDRSGGDVLGPIWRMKEVCMNVSLLNVVYFHCRDMTFGRGFALLHFRFRVNIQNLKDVSVFNIVSFDIDSKI